MKSNTDRNNLGFGAETPEVTVSILTYKRPEGIKKTLESVLMQDYPNLEIIVVDDGSGAGIPELIQRNYPSVKVIGLLTNQGSCAGRNHGVGKAKGEIVITIDDDVYFDSKEAIHKIVEIFYGRPEIGCLVFKIFNASTGGLDTRDWSHPRNIYKYSEESFPTDCITEGACAFRRKAFLEAGGYYSRLFIGGEGPELALRLWNKGYEVLYTPEVLVWHSHNVEGRLHWRPFYFNTRNYIWTALRNYRYIICLKFLFRNLSMMFFHSIRNGQLKPFFRGIMDGLKGASAVLRDREPISRETELLLEEVRALSPGIIYRIKKHWHKSQI